MEKCIICGEIHPGKECAENETTVSNSASVTGLSRLSREAIEVEDEWQLVQDHVEDENWTEVPPALNRMREKMLNLEAYVFAKKILSA